MEVINTFFKGEVKVLKPQVFSDNRGFFLESYNEKKFHEIGITNNFIQDNHSFSKDKNTIRAIHFQKEPMAQSKLVRVVKGTALDIIVDLREDSPTYLKFEKVELSEDNFLQVYIPKGFGHGFCTLTDDCHFLYKVDQFYSHEHNAGIIWNDPSIAIDWPTKNPILSEQDKKWICL